MRITILTLFPEMFNGFLTNSIIKRAIGKEIVEVKIVNIRDFTEDKYGLSTYFDAEHNAPCGACHKCKQVLSFARTLWSESHFHGSVQQQEQMAHFECICQSSFIIYVPPAYLSRVSQARKKVCF